ncbi:substrate-binding domain-containing protein [Pseudonocardia nematodicida]|uniref:Substrate-binding domain-containing protein n=1 Tax=Pseudonocardia nematodicida TaxID=1206997 RepID=A0ABV1K567_9PSEU
MRGGRTHTLTLVVPDIVNPYFAVLVDATFAAAAERGYAVFVEQAGQRRGDERHAADSLQRVAFDGVVFSPTFATRSELESLAERMPVVLLGESTGDTPLDVVRIDNVAAAHDVTAHVLAQGRTAPGFVGATTDIAPEPAAVSNFTQQQGAEAARRLLAAGPEIDALVCADDLLAIGVMAGLRRMGVRVPDDVAVTGWDNVPDGAYLHPTLTTLEPHADRIAAAAVARLADRIDGACPPAEHVVVPHEVVVRESSTRLDRP